MSAELFVMQRDLELKNAKALKKTIKTTSNKFVRTLLEGIMHDCLKHAAICDLLMDIVPGQVSTSSESGEALNLSEVLDEHIRAESEMISGLQALLEKMEDERSKSILNNLLSDEHRHHSTLTELSDLMNQQADSFEKYYDLFDKYMLSGADHGRKQRQF